MENRNIQIDPRAIGSAKLVPKSENYILSGELKAAVEVALRLGQPLLLTGEPGTGKTRLAYKIASDLAATSSDFLPEPLIFNTKTTSTASDLFYTYDAIRHFQDASIRRESGTGGVEVTDYIQLQAMGKAIGLTNPEVLAGGNFLPEAAERSRSSVVLIDEIDKAPRDFPNDILNELENYEFQIKEDNNRRVTKGDGQNIVVVMTSNSERNLPDAFLRRCVFYHIPFPSNEQLLEIAKSHLGDSNPYANGSLIDYFTQLRSMVIRKKPATAELIAWLKILEMDDFLKDPKVDFNNLTEEQKYILEYSHSILIKTAEDLERIR